MCLLISVFLLEQLRISRNGVTAWIGNCWTHGLLFHCSAILTSYKAFPVVLGSAAGGTKQRKPSH